jgi:hypothetical protein
VKNWFQTLLLNSTCAAYDAVVFDHATKQLFAVHWVGPLHKLNPALDPQLETAWFQPLIPEM